MSEKIRPQHLERKAILYVRQSSPYQGSITWRARSCSMRWKSDCGTWDGVRSKWSMRTWEDLQPGW